MSHDGPDRRTVGAGGVGLGTDLECVVVGDFPVAEVRVVGTLATATAPHLRGTVLKCLVEQPAAVVLDLSAAYLAEPAAALVLPALARRAGRWPGCPLVVYGAPPGVAAALRRLAVSRVVPLLPDRDAAQAYVAECRVPARLIEDLPFVPSAAAHARCLVQDGCHRWRLSHLSPRAEVVVTELVVNAVRHGRAPVRLAVSRLDRYLHLAVSDGSPTPPRLCPPDHEYGPEGRGLVVVEAYTASWGTLETPDGKVVWASLRIP